MTTIGEMDCLITIHRWGWIKQVSGGLVDVQTAAFQVWAKVVNKGGRILTDNQQAQWSYDYQIITQYESDKIIYSNDTVFHDSKRLAIKSVQLASEGNKQEVILQCSTTGTANTDNLTTMLYTLNYTGVGEEAVVNLPTLHGKVLKGVFKDGVEFRFITTGSVDTTKKEVLFNNSTDDLTWSVPFVPGENAFFQYADV